MLDTIRKKRVGAFADRGRPWFGSARFLRCIEDVETLDLATSTLLKGAYKPTSLARLALASFGNGVALDFAQAAEAGVGRRSGGVEEHEGEKDGPFVAGCECTRPLTLRGRFLRALDDKGVLASGRAGSAHRGKGGIGDGAEARAAGAED